QRAGALRRRGGRRGVAARVPRHGPLDRVRVAARGGLVPGAPALPPTAGAGQRLGRRPVHPGRPRRAGLDPGHGAVDGAGPGGGHRRRPRGPRRRECRVGAGQPEGTGGVPRVNLASLIDAHPPDAVALVHDGATTTYGELRERAAAARGALTALGIVPGDRVGLALRNDPHFVAWWLAVLGAGAVAVPLNPSAPAPELGRAVNAALPRVAIVAEGVADAFESVEHVLEVGREVPLATAEAIVAREPGDVAVLLFTAGTAGSPKAAMLTHANLLTNQEQIQASGRGLLPDDVSLGVLPLFHIFGLNVVLGLTLRLGATVVLVERFDAAGTLDVVREHAVSVLAGAPPMYAAWSAGAGNDDGALASVRLAASGAAKLPVEVARRFEARFG